MLCLRWFCGRTRPVSCLKQRCKIIPGIFSRKRTGREQSNASNGSFPLAYQEYEGDTQEGGNPILVLHGMLGSKKNWHSFCKSYNARTGTQIIAVDARNHGQSPRSAHMTYPLLAGDVAETLKELSIHKTDVIGHSMGGKIAMEVALSMPSSIEKLILVDTLPQRSKTVSMVNMVLPAMVNFDLTCVKTKKDADEMLVKSIPLDGLRAWVLTNLYKDKEQKFHWHVDVDAVHNNLGTLFDGIELNERAPYPGETLFIGGSESGVLRNVDMNKLRKMFPKAELEMIPGAGHFVHADKPKEFLETVHKFLR